MQTKFILLRFSFFFFIQTLHFWLVFVFPQISVTFRSPPNHCFVDINVSWSNMTSFQLFHASISSRSIVKLVTLRYVVLWTAFHSNRFLPISWHERGRAEITFFKCQHLLWWLYRGSRGYNRLLTAVIIKQVIPLLTCEVPVELKI